MEIRCLERPLKSDLQIERASCLNLDTSCGCSLALAFSVPGFGLAGARQRLRTPKKVDRDHQLEAQTARKWVSF